MVVISFLVVSLLATFQAAPIPEECAVEQSFLLQVGIQVDRESQKLADLLLEVRKECLRATSFCLPVLEKLRWAVWPHVQAEMNVSSGPWMPGWNLEPLSDVDTQRVGVSRAGTKMGLRHIFKAAGFTACSNLQKVTTGFRPQAYLELCNSFHSTNLRHRAFTFVRNPISRFLSGYVEIDFRTRSGLQWPIFDSLAELLREYPAGSPLRAAAFFKEFLRSGIDANGHVRPQLEFLQPLSGCSLPMDFIGKTEQAEEHWAKLFAMQNETVPKFDSLLAVHSHGDRDEDAMKTFLASSPKYTRALCWIYLGDFAVFEYELPDECQQEPMQSAVAKLRQVSLSGNPLA
eukprot:Skav210959  [mRNA]  locus=scaffold713:358424:359458:+ [translate_table: standard]